MTAPSSAYVLADGQFLKVMTRKGSTLYPCYLARFLSGTSAQGGYATTSSTMRERIKSLFHLDEIADVREEQADGSFVKSWTQVYRSQAIMNQYGGSRYYDAGNGVYYQLDHSNDLWWSVVCLDSSGNEHDFEGDITWEGGAIGASTAPVG